MALFEGTVAFVMISAAMKSMDPSLEESSRVLGAGKLRTALRITLPLVAPGVLSATIFVFAEMLGSFAAAFVLGIPGRFYVVTTVIWQATLSFPPDYGRAAAMGLSLFAVMLVTLTWRGWCCAMAPTPRSPARHSARVRWMSASCAGRCSASPGATSSSR